MTILNPVLWSWDRLRLAATTIGSDPSDRGRSALHDQDIPIARIGLADLRQALEAGFADFAANRTDIIVLCVVYPVLGLVLARLASGAGLLPMIFPLASGFALVGPLAALGLYELSRRREDGMMVQWSDMFRVLRSPAIGSIIVLGLILTCVYLLWLLAAQAIYELTLGPLPPVSVAGFLHSIFTTGAGATMIVLGVAAGLVFALVAMGISVISFPLLLDRNVGLEVAVRASIRAIAANPGVMAVWGLVVTAALVIGAVPLLLGMAVVLPVLGHATWHLYRRVAMV